MTAKIKLNAASGGGSFSLQAPSSSSNNRVFTLPDSADATLLTSTSATGKILQVVQAVKTDTFSSSSASLVDITGLSLSITPSATSSKILVSVDVKYSITVVNRWILLQLVRGSTAIYQGDTASSRSRASVFASLFDASGRSTHIMNSHIHFLDSPNTTSATTYKLQGTCQNDSSPSFVINRSKDDDDANYGGRTASSITAMEVAA